ncbi:ABC transporter permease [Bacillus testis]|uniref:ABC transporter permease n=1 Tax=Bacillus testis TaxID=1622072 RepID=UPI00067F4DB7|nr:ABC transporter permease [Bacillus testis]
MFLAIREMKHSKFRYLLIGLIMVLISFLTLFITGLANGLSADNASALQEMKGTHFVVDKNADQRLTRSQLASSEADKISKEAGKGAAAPLNVMMATLLNGDKKIDATFFAVDANSDLLPKVTEGESITNNSSNEVVADESLKEHGLSVGDKVRDERSGREFMISGFTANASFSHSPVLFMNFKVWSSLQGTHAVDGKSNGISALVLQVDQKKGEELAKNHSGVEIITKDQALKGIPGYSEEQGSLLMMIAFLFVIAAFVLAVFFYVITIQKLNQFGVMKAIGAKTGYLALNLISQILVVTVLALAFSIALTYGIAALLPASMPFQLSAGMVGLCSGLFLAVSLIGSLISLFKVAKIDAIEAIGRAA